MTLMKLLTFIAITTDAYNPSTSNNNKNNPFNPTNANDHNKPHNLVTIIIVALVWECHTGQRELRI
jgi:hypothetical protein